MKIEFYNISEEAVTLNVSTVATRGVKWLNGVPTSLTIPNMLQVRSFPEFKVMSLTKIECFTPNFSNSCLSLS